MTLKIENSSLAAQRPALALATEPPQPSKEVAVIPSPISQSGECKPLKKHNVLMVSNNFLDLSFMQDLSLLELRFIIKELSILGVFVREGVAYGRKNSEHFKELLVANPDVNAYALNEEDFAQLIEAVRSLINKKENESEKAKKHDTETNSLHDGIVAEENLVSHLIALHGHSHFNNPLHSIKKELHNLITRIIRKMAAARREDDELAKKQAIKKDILDREIRERELRLARIRRSAIEQNSEIREKSLEDASHQYNRVYAETHQTF